jgi:hypothetical protein
MHNALSKSNRFLLLTCLLAAACGDYSNRTLAEDLEFIHAVPDQATLELRVAETTPRQTAIEALQAGLAARLDALGELGEFAVYYLASVVVTTSVNVSVFSFLEVVNWMTDNLLPAERTENRRIWGPWPAGDWDNTEVRLVMERLEPGRYQINWQHRGLDETHEDINEGWLDCIAGEIQPGQGFRGRGTGHLTVDMGNCSQFANSGETGTAVLDYDTLPDSDNPDGKTEVILVFSDFVARKRPDSPQASVRPLNATYTYLEQSDRSGAFSFKVDTDIDQGENGRTDIEQVQFDVRWLADGSGTCEATATGGDLGIVSLSITECWNTRHRRVFYADNLNLYPEQGDPQDCSL